mmetsp:Transcript_6483/g.11580  ORF Transcript_6483/g.11580 Transcript_6483/m.11580 type:complete len:88 (-) Transcript_6483:1073-1336(-)
MVFCEFRFAHGGSGVLLNYAALRMMQPIVSECVQTLPLSCYAGDMQMAACLFMSNVPTPIRLNEMTGEVRYSVSCVVVFHLFLFTPT